MSERRGWREKGRGREGRRGLEGGVVRGRGRGRIELWRGKKGYRYSEEGREGGQRERRGREGVREGGQ